MLKSHYRTMPEQQNQIEKIEEAILTPRKISEPMIQNSDYLSTGSTLLNLACSGNVLGGFVKGKYFFLVGDSASGKTFLSLTCLAEASINPHFDDYRFIYDNVEGGALMNLQKFFGTKVVERLESPFEDEDGTPRNSETIEDFYFNVDDAVQEEKPFIYILDSMDALSSDAEWKKFGEKKTASRGGKEAKGDYGDGKAKMNSSSLRRVLAGIRDTKSILIIINQTRDNIKAGPFEPQKTRSGGHALKFYTTLEMWSSVRKKLTKSVRGITRQIGIVAKVTVKKNRLTGQERSIEIPIFHSYGMDDIESCIQYLLTEKHWKKTGGTIKAKEFEFEGTMGKLICKIEEEQLETKLRKIVDGVWKEIEELSKVQRKTRYE